MAVITYKCPNSGAEIKFDPKLQKGKCDFCFTETIGVNRKNVRDTVISYCDKCAPNMDFIVEQYGS